QPRAETWQCRTAVESQQAAAAAPPSFAFDAKKIFRFGGGEIRADVGGRALGRRRRHRVGPRNLTTLDVAGRLVEPAAAAQETLPAKRARIALRGTGTTGRQFPCLAGRSWSPWLPDGHGG